MINLNEFFYIYFKLKLIILNKSNILRIQKI